MYYYVYDEFVQDQKYERELALVESRLTDLGISGKIARLALFRDAAELIRDEVKKGATTVVAIGNDLTLRKVIDAVGDSGVAIAVVPMGTSENSISNMLGIPVGVAACDVLSARITENMDVGVVNGERFLNEMKIEATSSIKIACDSQFDMSPIKKSVIEIRNLALADEDVRAANPSDGKLEIIIRGQKVGWLSRKKPLTTIVPVERARIECDEVTKITVDGETFESDIFEIGVLLGRLKIVTGKERKF